VAGSEPEEWWEGDPAPIVGSAYGAADPPPLLYDAAGRPIPRKPIGFELQLKQERSVCEISQGEVNGRADQRL
jgi:hypothetical protein